MFANHPFDQVSISSLDTSMRNSQHYKVRIKGKVEQSWKRSTNFPYNSA